MLRYQIKVEIIDDALHCENTSMSKTAYPVTIVDKLANLMVNPLFLFPFILKSLHPTKKEALN